MSYFIAILPPPDYAQRISDFLARWDYCPGWPPHITVKAQGGLTDDEAWLPVVADVCRAFSPFQISLHAPAMFGADVLFLQVKSAGVRQLHRALLAAVAPSPIERAHYFEGELFTPHLTLGQTDGSLQVSELREMRDQVAGSLAPYPTFTVDHLRVFRLDAQGVYRSRSELPLQGRC